MSDPAELRRLAEAATPGVWIVPRDGIIVNDDGYFVLYARCRDIPKEPPIPTRHEAEVAIRPEDAAYIAAMHPETTLALLDELAELRSAVITFCAPWAVLSAQRMGLPPNHIYAQHYDLLAKCGARMVDFVRHDNEQ